MQLKQMTPALLAILCLLCLFPIAQAQDLGKVKVTGDRVNLRSQPNLDSTILSRAHRGDIYEANYIGDEWVQIRVDGNAEAWVAAEFLDGDKVIADQLRARKGAGIDFDVRMELKQGDTVVRTGKAQGGWVQIQPPPLMNCWISRRFVSQIASEPTVVAEVLPKVEPPAGLNLVPLPGQGDRVKTTGVLRHYHFKDGKPSHYRLANLGTEGERDVFFVHADDLQLRGFMDKSVMIKGAQFWVQGESMPLLVPRIVAEISPHGSGR